jgi:hypothetical protein
LAPASRAEVDRTGHDFRRSAAKNLIDADVDELAGACDWWARKALPC